ncbi:hypothetical protein FHR81_004653 [Actinoalloteichus hoggarensis]|uniref:Uncharacterized protein n=1 Tax=Actinoalloteichus hoggarensis TaxID=1470176 RepID=A0A221W3U7_9PSEU|nr:hypothetical protein AHOG_14500 [Actinoalloteichus hoggarensis]MBB5923582.1 hypothetical protein [Actinoalloteichus hoggarensis]
MVPVCSAHRRIDSRVDGDRRETGVAPCSGSWCDRLGGSRARGRGVGRPVGVEGLLLAAATSISRGEEEAMRRGRTARVGCHRAGRSSLDG